MKNLVLILLMLTLSIAASAQKQCGQKVYFKNGSIVTGVVNQDMTTGKIKISTKDGNLFVFDISEVDSIISVNNISTTTTSGSSTQFKEKGFFNVNEFTLGFGVGQGSSTNLVYGLSAVFGYQFFPQLTLGGGVAGELWYKGYAIPIFADVRYYPINKRASPYLGLQGGYSIASVPFAGDYFRGGLYLSPIVGARVYVSKRVGLNIGFSYQLRQFSLHTNSFFAHYLALRVGVSI